MKERKNWIDWMKAMAVVTVVFCHLPQSQEWEYFRFLQTVIISVFFWVSGYLKAGSGSRPADKGRRPGGEAPVIAWRRYWTGLILPYLIYNIVVYPYWIARFYMQHGGWPDWFQALRPILGALLLEHENSFCEPLNGPLWYLPAILVMHIILDLSSRTRQKHLIMSGLCVASIVLYGLNNAHHFWPYLTPIGILRGLPFYYIGYLSELFIERTMGIDPSVQYAINILHRRQCMKLSLVYLILSVLLFHWHLSAFHSGHHWLHIALFYPSNMFFVLAVSYLARSLDSLRSPIVTNLSIGTLVIIGLHYPLISLANLLIAQALHIQGILCYHWYEALPTALAITALLYPIILLAKRHAPILLGKKRA